MNLPMGGVPDERRLIREVWASNFEKEMELIRLLVKDYPYIAMVSSIRFVLFLLLFATSFKP